MAARNSLASEQAATLFDECLAALRAGGGRAVSEHLRRSVHELRSTTDPNDWSVVTREAKQHSLWPLLLEDPFTWRAHAKPRGYAGDAPLLDLIYAQVPPPETSDIGRAVFADTTGSSTAGSVRWRRDHLATLFDDLADRVPGARVASIGCGHLREAQCSAAVRERRLREVVALDQDAESLALVAAEQSSHHVTPIEASVMDVARQKLELGEFDFVYSAGVFDYLADGVAHSVAAEMFRWLRPGGGRLLVGNYVAEPYDRAYMECFMDWHLTFRTRDEVAAFASRIPQSEIAKLEVYTDDPGNVHYLALEKR